LPIIFVTCAVILTSAYASTYHSVARASDVTLDISFSGSVNDGKAAALTAWLHAVATSMENVYGRFPLPEVRVRVVSDRRGTDGGGSPVPFGRVTRNGGEMVELFVNPDRPIEDFYADWTATHEFSHLLLPRISYKQRWISEGFASYYQNVLMARNGSYTTEQALKKLSEGFARGRASRPELSPNEAAREGVSKARYKIYWSGAAIALLADVELRQRSGSRESLDVVLGRFQECCLPSRRRWSGTELFTQFDSLIDEPVFMPLYRRYADTRGFPEIERTLQLELLRTDVFAVRTNPN
jgi:hypothetical protein